MKSTHRAAGGRNVLFVEYCEVMHRQENKDFGKVARFMRSTRVVRCFIFCRSAWRELLMEGARNESEYDLYSAITFLMVYDPDHHGRNDDEVTFGVWAAP